MARYVERAENTARLVSVNAFLLLDLPHGIAPGWQPLIAISGMGDDYRARYGDECTERGCVKFLIADAECPGSIISSLASARENCRTVREILPRKCWEALTELYLFAKENAQSGVAKKGRHAYLERIIEGSQLITGLLGSTLMRDEGYQFIRIGRHLERADMTTRIIDVRTSNLLPDEATDLQPFETIQWMSVLKSMTGYHAYRRKMQTHVQRSEVLRFLLQDTTFPRSVAYCMQGLEESLGELQNNLSVFRPVRHIVKSLEAAKVEDLKQQELHVFIDELQLGFIRIDDMLAKAYFLREEAELSAAAAG
jgi:uncharacterized alpha-E superfamily protein